MTATYRSAPCTRCYSPSRVFDNASAALEHAYEASRLFSVTYSVFAVIDGRPKHVRTFYPPPADTRRN